ncbi:ATP-binding cassette domain-containing protein [Corynebacterium durum]|uniref:ATP-binding cassette domain-containing protein n=1 Tax=Corynebacterium durum TaxID=61592 RepID=UPI00366A9B5C
MGPSGCGKTTLVRALCGLIPHCLPSEYSGSLNLAGTEVADASVQSLAETVAYVGQSPDAAVVTRAVHDDVAFPLQNLCLPRTEITARVEGALRAVGLIERIWDDPWMLSGGQRQRLSVAVALAMRPQLLVLDEPTSTIDATGREEFYALISSLTASGTAVVVIDHDLDPVLPILLVALVLPGALQFASTGPSKLVPDQPHPALTSSVNEMTLLELYERYFFDDPALLDGHTIRTAGMLHRGDNGWEVRRFRIICCAADASEYAVPITGTVPHAQEGKWVEVIGTASTQPELALAVRSITSIREPARPYL